MSTEPQALAMITGRPVTISWGGLIAPSWFGRTTLSIKGNRLTESTRKLVFERHCTLLLSDVESVEICSRGNAALLVLGILTCWIFGIGLIFVFLYFYVREQYLVIYSKNNKVALIMRGDDKPYRQFMESVLDYSEKLRPAPAALS
jgi:hypothetical protein